MGNNNQFLPKHAFLPSLNHFFQLKAGGGRFDPPHVLTYLQKPMQNRVKQRRTPRQHSTVPPEGGSCIDRKKSKIGFLLQKSKIWKYFGRGKPFPTFFEAQNYLIFAPTLGSFDPFFPIFAIQHREKTHFDLQCWLWLMPRENFDEISILHVK